MIEPRRAVLDAGPIIHLDGLGALDLLEGFGELITPPAVWAEVLVHRPALTLERVPGLRMVESVAAGAPELVALVRSFDLDAGEIAALGLLGSFRDAIPLCDDAAARLAAESLGFQVRGTVGLIVRAIRRERRTTAQVKALLESIPSRSTLHISRELLRRVIAGIESS